MSKQRHIIQKQVIELELPTQRGAMDLQRKVSRVYQGEVIQSLEAIFDQLTPSGTTLRIPKLEINLGSISADRIEKEFAKKCIAAIQKELLKQQNNPHLITDEAKEQTTEASTKPSSLPNAPQQITKDIGNVFTNFLETGMLPWFAKVKTIEELEATLLHEWGKMASTAAQAFTTLLANSPTAQTRLINQCTIDFVAQLIENIYAYSTSEQKYILDLIASWLGRSLAPKEIRVFYMALLNQISEKAQISTEYFEYQFNSLYQTIIQKGSTTNLEDQQSVLSTQPSRVNPPEAQHFKKQIADIILAQSTLDWSVIKMYFEDAIEKENNAIARQSSATDATAQIIKHETLAIDSKSTQHQSNTELSVFEESYFIENAGLVICAYFLQPFFKGFELTTQEAFKDEKAQERAIHLTQYLVMGDENSAEFHLPLNKLLCGIPLNVPVDRFIELSDEEKTETDNLLQHLIQYWTILGNTSVEALRTTFLQRKGKLSYEPSFSTWLLQVEKTGYDICVERLPWTISVIKLPWMPERLQVEWV